MSAPLPESCSCGTGPVVIPMVKQRESLPDFTPSGAEKFSEATKRLVGEKISIWVDDELLSAPYVHKQITGSMAQIAGSFSVEEVREYAAKINGNPFEGCTKIRVTYKGKTYGYDELSELYSAVN